jgi:hypothetical protein
MKQYAIIPSSGDLIEEVADRCVSEGNDYSGNLVVFPGKRPAHFLRKRIAERRGAAFIPPVILSMEEFIDRAYEKSHPAVKKMETIDAVALLFEIHRSMERPLGGKGFLNLEAFFPLGLRIYRDIEELLIEEIDIRRVKSVEGLVDDPLPPEATAGLQSLSFFFEKFYATIEPEGFSSRSERFRYVSAEITSDALPFGKIILAGFYALTECERRLFRRLLSWERSFFLFQDGPGLDEKLTRLGFWVGQESRPESVAAGEEPKVFFHKSPDSHGQIFGLAGLLKEQMEGEGRDDDGSPEKTVIVLPSSETLFPLLYHALPLVPRGEYNISMGYPLERTPTWGFLSSLIQVVTTMDDDRLYVPDYLSLVLHPYTKNIYMEGSAERTRIMFHALEETLSEDRTKSFVRLEEIEGRADFFRMVAAGASTPEEPVAPAEISEHLKMIHDALIRKVLTFSDIKDFAGKMMEILAFIYDHSSARLHPYFHPFAESFMKELDSLRGSRIRDLSFSERNSYFHFLRRYVAHCFTPFEGTPLKGLQVLGFLETRNLTFQRTFILDANEDVIPDTRKEESLLPVKVRQILAMPTYEDRDMLGAYYFHTLVRGSAQVHVFFVENGRKEKSRFVEQLLWEKQKKDGNESASGYVESLGYCLSLENSLPPDILKTPAVADFLKTRKYDATSLDVYLRCPLQFYHRYVLNLARREEVSPDVERLDIGRIVHKILHIYFGRRMHKRLTEGDIDYSEMQEVSDFVFREAYGPNPVGQVYLLKLQIIRQMEAFLKRYQMPLILGMECEILHLEHRVEATVAPFRYTGIIDRIERRDGIDWILDYKTGSSANRLKIDFTRLRADDRASWNEAIGSLQLPLYLFLYERVSGLPTQPAGAMFLLLGKVRVDSSIELPLFGAHDDIMAGNEAARQVIFALTEEVVDPQTPFTPEFRSKNSCLFCDYQYLCGQQG